MQVSSIHKCLAATALVVTASCVHPRGAALQDGSRLPRSSSESIPSNHWIDSYFGGFNTVARAAKLTPLRDQTLRTDRWEVRIWSMPEIASPKSLYRFFEEGGQVRGELIYYFPDKPSDTSMENDPRGKFGDMMRNVLAGQCTGFSTQEGTGICRARFLREPEWGKVLRSIEADGLWSLPDPSTFPADNIDILDGWSFAVELREGMRYRTYLYSNPEWHPSWPTSAHIQRIAKRLQEIDTLLAPRTSQ